LWNHKDAEETYHKLYISL